MKTLNEVLLEFGKLKIQEKEINESISKLSEGVKFTDPTTGEIDFYPPQLYQYFQYNYDRQNNYAPISLEDWGELMDIGITKQSYALLKLIEERKVIKYNLGICKTWITKYAKNLVKENNNER